MINRKFILFGVLLHAVVILMATSPSPRKKNRSTPREEEGEREAVAQRGEVARIRVGCTPFSLAWHPTENYIAIGLTDAQGIIAAKSDGSSAIRIAREKTLKSSIRSIVFTPDGKTVIAGSSKGSILAYDWVSRKRLWRKSTHKNSPISCMCIFNHNLVTADESGNLRIWSIPTAPQIPEELSEEKVQNIANLNTPRLLHTLWATEKDMQGVAGMGVVSDKEGRSVLVVGSYDGKIAIISGRGKVVAIWEFGLYVQAFTVVNNKAIISSGRDISTYVINITPSSEDITPERVIKKVDKISLDAVEPDGSDKYGGVFIGGSEGEVSRIRFSSTKKWVPKAIGYHAFDVMALALDPTRKKLASAGLDEIVRVWDLEEG
mmetsp:Transcript_22058/g.34711  ORF Transcript_22058/g.34711 Transcript_22058/m.34711 type:complete len:376 (-) Transcript_22058:79-1206(-)